MNNAGSKMSLTFPVDAKLKDGSPVQLVLADQPDVEVWRWRGASSAEVQSG